MVYRCPCDEEVRARLSGGIAVQKLRYGLVLPTVLTYSTRLIVVICCHALYLVHLQMGEAAAYMSLNLNIFNY